MKKLLKTKKSYTRSYSSAMASPPMSDLEQISRIKAFFSKGYLDELYAKFGIDKNEQPKNA